MKEMHAAQEMVQNGYVPHRDSNTGIQKLIEEEINMNT